MAEVANAQVAVFPTFKGFRSKINQEVATSGKSAGQSFQKAFQGAAQLTVDTSKLSKAVGVAGGAVARARLAQQTAAGKVRVAEAQLAEAISKTGSASARTVAAEEKLASANRGLKTSTDKTEAAVKDLTTAQERLEAATKDTGQAGATAAKKYASGWAGVKQRISGAASSVSSGFSARFGKEAKAAGAKSGGMFGGGMVGALGKAGVIGMVVSSVVGPAIDGFNQITGSASDLNETVNKSKSVFGGSFASVDKWSKGAAKGLGMSRSEALAAASGFGDMFTQIGATKGEAAKMSKSVLQMSADLGSYNNLPTAEVSDSIAAAFRGEYDSLQRVIPNINAARVEKQALAETGKKNAKSLTAEEKAHAVLAIVQKDGAKAMGDFAKTSGEVANKSKIMDARAADLGASFGKMLLPVKQIALDGFGSLITVGEQVTAWLKKNPEVIAGAEAAFSLLGDALGAIATVVWPILKAAFSGILGGIGFIARSVAGFLELIGNIPGPDFQWARDAAVKVNKVAGGLETLRGGLDSIGEAKPEVDVKVMADGKKARADLVKLVGKKRAAKILAAADTKAGYRALEKLVGKKRAAQIKAEAKTKAAQDKINAIKGKTVGIKINVNWIGGLSKAISVDGTGAGKITLRASGGPVSAGRLYMVGEEGPELVRFDRSGTVIPAHITKSLVARSRSASPAMSPTAAVEPGLATFNLFDVNGVLLGSMRGEIARNQSHNRTVARMGAR